MRFLLDQSTDARLIPYLHGLGHDATRIGRDHPHGMRDSDVLAVAVSEGRILITDDRDFGELIYRQGQSHAGVIFLRLDNDTDVETKVERISFVLKAYADQLDHFLVVTHEHVRVGDPP